MNILLQIKKLIKKIIPYQYHFHLFIKTRKYVDKSIRKDKTKFIIDDDIYLEIYWKIYGTGKGPALIFNAFQEEVLRFDFYGKTGHFHPIVTELEREHPSYALSRNT